MRLHFVTVPVYGSDQAEAELNRFLATHRVVAIDRELVVNGDRTAWAVCVSYTDGPPPAAASGGKRPRLDYKEVLSEEHFRVFAELRTLRKTLADADGVPPYNVFNNEQLAAMVTGGVRSKKQLAAIPGVGPARVEKYADAFLARLAELLPTKEG